MNNLYKITTLILVVLTATSCTTAIEDYDNSPKPFDIKNYFNGPVIAWGVVQNFSDKVTRRFCVEINGSWQGNEGVLAEKFYFNDGEISYRNWRLIKQEDGSYQGTAEDVDGVAIGVHKGIAFQFRYNLLLTVDGDTYNVSMDDWMYQLDDYRVINKTAMSKLGVNVANITLFFDKSIATQQCNL